MQATTINAISQKDHDKIRDFLMGHPVGVLATVDSDGMPNASTIYFSVRENLEITFTTKRDTRKHNSMSKFHDVALAVYNAEDQAAVQIRGKANEVVDPAVAQGIFHGTIHAAKQTGEDTVPPIAKLAAGPYVAYAITPEIVSISEYGWGDTYANALEHANDPKDTSDPS